MIKSPLNASPQAGRLIYQAERLSTTGKPIARTFVFSDMLSTQDIDRIIEMAWEDRTPFEAIKVQFDISEQDVIALMRRQLKRQSFERWRKRVNSGVSQKHSLLRDPDMIRFRCSRQRTISGNKISKRK